MVVLYCSIDIKHIYFLCYILPTTIRGDYLEIILMSNMSFPGMYHSGICPAQLNSLLSSLNLPHLRQILIRRQCDETCLRGLEGYGRGGVFVQHRCVFLFVFQYYGIVSKYCLTKMWFKVFISYTYFYWGWYRGVNCIWRFYLVR